MRKRVARKRPFSWKRDVSRCPRHFMLSKSTLEVSRGQRGLLWIFDIKAAQDDLLSPPQPEASTILWMFQTPTPRVSEISIRWRTTGDPVVGSSASPSPRLIPAAAHRPHCLLPVQTAVRRLRAATLSAAPSEWTFRRPHPPRPSRRGRSRWPHRERCVSSGRITPPRRSVRPPHEKNEQAG